MRVRREQHSRRGEGEEKKRKGGKEEGEEMRKRRERRVQGEEGSRERRTGNRTGEGQSAGAGHLISHSACTRHHLQVWNETHSTLDFYEHR